MAKLTPTDPRFAIMFHTNVKLLLEDGQWDLAILQLQHCLDSVKALKKAEAALPSAK